MLLNDYWTHGFVGRTGGTSENGLPRYRFLIERNLSWDRKLTSPLRHERILIKNEELGRVQSVSSYRLWLTDRNLCRRGWLFKLQKFCNVEWRTDVLPIANHWRTYNLLSEC